MVTMPMPMPMSKEKKSENEWKWVRMNERKKKYDETRREWKWEYVLDAFYLSLQAYSVKYEARPQPQHEVNSILLETR